MGTHPAEGQPVYFSGDTGLCTLCVIHRPAGLQRWHRHGSALPMLSKSIPSSVRLHRLGCKHCSMARVRGNGSWVDEASVLEGSFHIQRVVVIAPRLGTLHQREQCRGQICSRRLQPHESVTESPAVMAPRSTCDCQERTLNYF
eukprot:scaffold3202_cov407-Prasinococcus_capsulatus_cf.AAC.7